MLLRCLATISSGAHILALIAASSSMMLGAATEGGIDFSSDRWDLSQARIVEHLGRKALTGSASLENVEFEDGVIEVDIAVTGARSYPGILFRVRDPGSYERVYIRPHRSGCAPPSLYSDVLQYTPVFNGVDSWQLHSGDGYTAPAVIPREQWFRIRLEVRGTRARLFVGESEQPALVIHELAHGRRRGAVGLSGPSDGSAFFANFSIRPASDLVFDPPPFRDVPPGMIRGWQLSRPLPALSIDMERPPGEQGLGDLAWKDVTSDPSGLVDISRYLPRSGRPDCVFARSVLRATEDRTMRLNIGYSDAVSVFLNGRTLFSANGEYQSRDPSFLGIVGLFDTLHLPLRKGDNELMLAVAESFGGWGFIAQDGDAVYRVEEVHDAWETGRVLSVPESAAYDPASGTIFVSNWEGYNPSREQGKQFISRLSIDGKIENLRWVEGLRNPTGLVARDGRLYAVEPTSLAEIDIASARIVARHDVPGAGGLNDVALGPDGTIFVSDMRNGILFRYAGGGFEAWLRGPEVMRPNGVWVEGGKLVWGNGDGNLKAADLETKKVEVLARLGKGTIDGIAGDGSGNILVSHYEGRVYRVSPRGEVVKLLDTTATGVFIADFTYIPRKRLLVGPGFTGNRVRAWSLAGRALEAR
jgi:sugar lactone lactonase YvrE